MQNLSTVYFPCFADFERTLNVARRFVFQKDRLSPKEYLFVQQFVRLKDTAQEGNFRALFDQCAKSADPEFLQELISKLANRSLSQISLPSTTDSSSSLATLSEEESPPLLAPDEAKELEEYMTEDDLPPQAVKVRKAVSRELPIQSGTSLERAAQRSLQSLALGEAPDIDDPTLTDYLKPGDFRTLAQSAAAVCHLLPAVFATCSKKEQTILEELLLVWDWTALAKTPFDTVMKPFKDRYLLQDAYVVEAVVKKTIAGHMASSTKLQPPQPGENPAFPFEKSQFLSMAGYVVIIQREIAAGKYKYELGKKEYLPILGKIVICARLVSLSLAPFETAVAMTLGADLKRNRQQVLHLMAILARTVVIHGLQKGIPSPIGPEEAFLMLPLKDDVKMEQLLKNAHGLLKETENSGGSVVLLQQLIMAVPTLKKANSCGWEQAFETCFCNSTLRKLIKSENVHRNWQIVRRLFGYLARGATGVFTDS